MDNYDNAKTELQQLNDEMTNTVRVYWSQKFAIDHELVYFIENNPEIRLDLVQATPEEVEEALETGECDFGLVQKQRSQWSNFSYISIPTACWYIALSTQNSLTRKGVPPRLADLEGMKFVCLALDRQHSVLTKRLCNRAGFEPEIVFQSTPKTCLDLVSEHDWVFLSPRDDFVLASGNTYYRELISFSPLYPDEYDSSLRLLYNEKKVLSEACKTFFDFIKSIEGATSITTSELS